MLNPVAILNTVIIPIPTQIIIFKVLLRLKVSGKRFIYNATVKMNVSI